jgi:hypothetical protein
VEASQKWMELFRSLVVMETVAVDWTVMAFHGITVESSWNCRGSLVEQ